MNYSKIIQVLEEVTVCGNKGKGLEEDGFVGIRKYKKGL